MSSEPSSPWQAVARHCWDHIDTATSVQKTAEKLNTLQVESVIPIVSTISATLLITPLQHSDRDALRVFCEQVRLLLGTEAKWASFASGDHWMLRIRDGLVSVDVSTSIPVSRPNALDL